MFARSITRSRDVTVSGIRHARGMTVASVLAQRQIEFTESTFVPLALGFFGLGVGYLVYGPEELFRFPKRNRGVDLTTGLWGIFMPGFLQFVTGVLLFVGLLWFHTFRQPALFMAALAFTAYGVHWWSLGLSRALGGDPRPNGFMAVAFTSLSALGIVVFFNVGDAPVGGLFIGPPRCMSASSSRVSACARCRTAREPRSCARPPASGNWANARLASSTWGRAAGSCT